MSGDVLQLEGFGCDIKGSVSMIICENSSSALWIPHEFIGAEMTTTVFLYGEHSDGTRGLLACEPWSIIMCMAGAAGSRNWSLLATMIKHMVGPVMLVVAPDVSVPAALVPHISEGTTMLVYRWMAEVGNLPMTVSSVFFPLTVQVNQIVGIQRAVWRGMPLRTSEQNLTFIVQETRPQGLCLVASTLEGAVVNLAWYKVKDSNSIVVDVHKNALGLWLSAISERILGVLKKQ